MQRFLAILCLSLSFLYAESQESAYYRALQAEKNGDETAAQKAFEEALAIPGPYTQEIQEILALYREKSNPWDFHFSGDFSFYGVQATETFSASSHSENAENLNGTTNFILEYDAGNLVHALGATLAFDVFFRNENAKNIDSDRWQYSAGLDYSILGNTFIVDIGADFNDYDNESWNMDYFAWVDKTLFRNQTIRAGLSLWGFGNTDGSFSSALYGSIRNNSTRGLSAIFQLGARFDADSTFQDSKWIGPALKPSLAYNFKCGFSLGIRTGFFYAFAIDNSDIGKIKKTVLDITPKVSWNFKHIEIYTDIEHALRYYSIPASSKTTYPDKLSKTKVRIGFSWDS